jgi:hypothetical protein
MHIVLSLSCTTYTAFDNFSFFYCLDLFP